MLSEVLQSQVLTGSKGGSLGSKMEGEEEGGEAAAAGISVRSLAVAACEDMAETHNHHRNQVKLMLLTNLHSHLSVLQSYDSPSTSASFSFGQQNMTIFAL